MALVWSSELATGNRQIDDQHLRLFQLCNDLQTALERNEGHAVVSRVLAALSVYVVAHFRMEEELMTQADYGGLEGHRAAHEHMRIQAEDMVDQFNLIGLDPTEVLRVMEEWLVGHVLNEDKAMARFLMERSDGS